MTTPSSLRLHVERGPEATRSMAAAWDELAERVCAPWFRTRTWVEAWSAAVGEIDLVVVTAASADGTPRALVPLAWQRRVLHPHLPLGVRYLGLAGAGRGAGDRLGTLSLDDHARAAVVVAAYREAGRAPLFLENVEAEEAAAFRRHLPVTVMATTSGPRMRLDAESPPDANCSKKLRAELNRMRGRLDADGFTSVWTPPGPGTSDAVHRLADLHARRWRTRGKEGLFEAWRIDLITLQAKPSSRQLGPWVHELVAADGGVVASLLLFRSHDSAAFYQLGWDPQWSQLSVGKVVVADAIRWAHSEGLATFDFLRGEEDYKYRLGGADSTDLTLISRGPAATVIEAREQLIASRKGERPAASDGSGSRFDAALRRSPLQLVASRRAAHRLRALCYHGIQDAGRFRHQLEHLVRDYHPVSMPEVLSSMEGVPLSPSGPCS